MSLPASPPSGGSLGDPLVARAAVAAVAEPRLLRSPAAVDSGLDVLDSATSLLERSTDRRCEPVRVLRQALGYACSVVIAADPGRGWPRFVEWSQCCDADVDCVVRENLKKKWPQLDADAGRSV